MVDSACFNEERHKSWEDVKNVLRNKDGGKGDLG